MGINRSFAALWRRLFIPSGVSQQGSCGMKLSASMLRSMSSIICRFLVFLLWHIGVFKAAPMNFKDIVFRCDFLWCLLHLMGSEIICFWNQNLV